MAAFAYAATPSGFSVVSDAEADAWNAVDLDAVYRAACRAETDARVTHAKAGRWSPCLREAGGDRQGQGRGAGQGRPVTVDKDAIRRLHGEGVKPTQIAQKLGVARSTVYEALKGEG